MTLSFESCITNAGEEQIKFLSEKYAEVFEALSIDYKVNQKTLSIKIAGYNLMNLLFGELGIHLFQMPYQNPIPIRVLLIKNEKKLPKAFENQVLRVYNEKNIMDLRTCLSNPIQILPDEFKVLLYAGIKENIRRKLL